MAFAIDLPLGVACPVAAVSFTGYAHGIAAERLPIVVIELKHFNATSEFSLLTKRSCCCCCRTCCCCACCCCQLLLLLLLLRCAQKYAIKLQLLKVKSISINVADIAVAAVVAVAAVAAVASLMSANF